MSEWSEQNLLLKGLKFIFSWLGLNIVFSIIFMAISIAILIAAIPILGLLHLIVHPILPPNPIPFYILIITIVLVIPMLYIGVFVATAYTSYLKNLKVKDMFALDEHFKLIKEHHHTAWTLVGKMILLNLLVILIGLIFGITIIGIIALPFICFFFQMAVINLCAQYGKEVNIGKYLE